MDNETIVSINQQYLDRGYATDIISFNLGDIENPIGDIYIGYEVAKANAIQHQQTFEDEIKLLFVHGILHLLDYRDYTDTEKAIMYKEQERLLGLTNELSNEA